MERHKIPAILPEQKRKRGRPKKVVEQPEPEKKLPTFSDKYEQQLIETLFKDEVEKRLKELQDNEESPYYEEQTGIHVKRDGIWDVAYDEEIHYFDPDLAYELTGYRPITMDQGLDFDPAPFREMAIIYEEKGEYTSFPPGGKPYNDFWKEQFKRCKDGYTVGKYRVTGDHYFFLNFYRMQTVLSDSTKAVTGRGQSFPSFLAKQYEFFHYVEMCEHIGKDICMLKARGLGFSEMLASLGVRPFITTRGFRSVYTAAAANQLDPVLDKCWSQLNWLAMNTQGGMKRLRQKIDNIKQKRASMVDTEGIEFGSLAEIEGIVADHPRKIRGGRTERLIYEEAGSNPNMITSWIQGNALVELGGQKIGLKLAGGTGGDSGPNLAGLAKIFNDPHKYEVLPYKNTHSRDGSVQYTGFFIPAHEFSLKSEYLDHRGVTNSVEFKKFYEERRKKLDGADLLDYCAEHCFTPDEALLRQGDNIFDSVVISDRLTQIRVHKMVTPPTPMTLLWDRQPGDETSMSKVKAQSNPNSKLLVIEPPILDEDGKPFKNLYVAGIDSIDMGTKDSASDSDVSDFCIVIKRRQRGMEPPKYVAIYKDRPSDIRVAYDTAMKLLTWYNCKALLEYTKISIQTYFTEKKKRNLFLSRPQFAMPANTRRQKELIGIQATEPVIKHGLELVAAFINDYCYGIDYDEMLEQMLNYSYQEKRKFDIVAAMQMAEIADEDLYGVTIAPVDNVNSQWKDYGYYTDENGIKRYGVIPQKQIQWAGLWKHH